MSKIKQYIERNYKTIMVFAFACILLYGCRIFDGIIGLDTEVTLEKSANYKEWLTMGRQGLYCLKYLFGLSDFEPFYVGALSILAWILVFVLWTYVLNEIYPMFKKTDLLIFGIVLISNPVWSEQFYFKCQTPEILLGIGLVAVSIKLSWEIVQKFQWNKLLLDVLVMLVCFSVYQAMVPLYITGVAMTFILFCYKHHGNEKIQNKDILQVGLLHIGIFLIGFISNTVITKLFFSGRTYLVDSMVGWSALTFKDCISLILQYMRDVLLARNVYYSISFLLSILFIIICIGVLIKRKAIRKNIIFIILGFIVLWGSVFFLTILLGKGSVVRSQFSLPFAIAFDVLLLVVLFREYFDSRVLKIMLVCAITFIILNQSSSLLRLFYTDYVRDREDKNLAYQISDKISEINDNGKDVKVVIIGAYSPKLNSGCVKGEMIGSASMFGFCCLNPEVNYSSTIRAVDFMKSLGFNYNLPGVEDVRWARKKALDMKSWPEKGSVLLDNNIAIVKLSNDFDAYSVLESDLIDYIPQDRQDQMKLKANIDGIYVDDANIKIQGWGVVEDQDNYFCNSIVLRNCETGKYYLLPTACEERNDVTIHFGDVFNYDECGFVAKTSLEKLNLENNSYEIYLLNTLNGYYHMEKLDQKLTKGILDNTEK